MVGMAIITEEVMKVKINGAIVAARSSARLTSPLPAGLFITSQFNLFTEDSASTSRYYLNDCFTAPFALHSHSVGKSWLVVALAEISL